MIRRPIASTTRIILGLRIDVDRLQLALLPPAPEKSQGYHHPQLVAAQRRGSAVHSVE